MDYITKSVSRNDLRSFSLYLRNLFDVSENGAFPVLESLDKLTDIFPNTYYEIVEDHCLPDKTMARCFQNFEGGYTIEIKESVYNGAYNNVGAFLGFICHEICHVFLFNIGYTPVYDRSFEENELPAYCSVEWQAKALCAEVMIPYEESKGMDEEEIISTYHVSKSFAKKRIKLGRSDAYEKRKGFN